MKKLFLSMVILFALGTILTACGDDASANTTEAEAEAEADDACGCSDQELQDYARSMNVTIDEAKENCCYMQKWVEENNK